MKAIRTILIITFLSAALMFGSPAVSGASGGIETPPAAVFTQDRNSGMLVRHNFVFDDDMMLPGGSGMDDGIYANIH